MAISSARGPLDGATERKRAENHDYGSRIPSASIAAKKVLFEQFGVG
jgi:hypothetical protein